MRVDTTRRGNLALHHACDSITDAVESARELMRRPPAVNASASNHAFDGTENWLDYYTWDKLESSLVSPATDLIDRIEQFKRRMESACPQFMRLAPRRKRVRNLDTGSEVDLDRYYAGADNYWEDIRRVRTPQRVIRIAVNYTVDATMDRDDLLPRGAVVLALADYLNRNGYGVEIDGVWFLKRFYAVDREGTARYLSSVRIKDSRAPLDIGSTAAACAEIAFARGCALMGMVLSAPQRVAYGYGKCLTPAPGELEALGGYDVVAPCITREADATAWLDKTITALSTPSPALVCSNGANATPPTLAL